MQRIPRLLSAVSLALGFGLVTSPALATAQPTGESFHGQISVEPAYDDTTGNLTFLATPIHVALPTNDSIHTTHSTAPLYLVIYPQGTSFPAPFNCEGPAGPDNCHDHDFLVAAVAADCVNLALGGVALTPGVSCEPSVYTTDVGVPGHDHLVAPPASHGDFNISWEVIEVMFTPKAVTDNAIQHLTTLEAIDSAWSNGDVIEYDLGFAFHCSVVPASTY